jgi:predicted Fe-Mo cluster-binding NifX family protein
VIDDTNYDVKQLRRAGVVLVAVPAGMGVDDALEKFQSGELK